MNTELTAKAKEAQKRESGRSVVFSFTVIKVVKKEGSWEESCTR